MNRRQLARIGFYAVAALILVPIGLTLIAIIWSLK